LEETIVFPAILATKSWKVKKHTVLPASSNAFLSLLPHHESSFRVMIPTRKLDASHTG